MNVPVIYKRAPGQVVYHLDQTSPVPTLPYELHEHVSAAAWASRIPQLIRLSKRYYKPAFEIIFFISLFISTITVPAAVRDIVLPSLEKKMKRREAHHQSNFVAFAIFIGVVLLFAVPYVSWKWIGQKRATALVKRWQAEDARSRPPGAFVPVWTVSLYGNFSSSVRLAITTPDAAVPSYFHPAAYMPSWINGPVDPGAGNGFPAANQGFEKAAMYGGLPLYGDRNRTSGTTLPPYVGNGVRPYTDEKA